jgi:hypothetical protein
LPSLESTCKSASPNPVALRSGIQGRPAQSASARRCTRSRRSRTPRRMSQNDPEGSHAKNGTVSPSRTCGNIELGRNALIAKV